MPPPAAPWLNFTAADWSDPKTVTVSGVPDVQSDGAQTYKVRYRVTKTDH